MWALRIAAIFVGSGYLILGLTMFLAPHKSHKFFGYLWELTPALKSQTEFAGLWHFGYAIPLLIAGILEKPDMIRHLIVFGGYPLALCIFYQQWKMAAKYGGVPRKRGMILHIAPLSMMTIYTFALCIGGVGSVF
ncbi:MAG: hypothetical protein ACPGVG_14055 [Mycobacterium sp.]